VLNTTERGGTTNDRDVVPRVYYNHPAAARRKNLGNKLGRRGIERSMKPAHSAFRIAIVALSSCALLAGVAVGWYGPLAGEDAALLQLPTIALLALLLVALWRGWIGTSGFLAAAAFLGLHSVAAYYGYCDVPYDDWLEGAFGVRLASTLESSRNHYDRLMHLCYGLLILFPARQAATRLLGVKGVAATWIAIEFILATSALYEVGEWLLAVFMAPDIADRYNGQQGDLWDAQKDMALAACGAVFAAALHALAESSRRFDRSLRLAVWTG
jgi:putative membrane protein